MSRDRHIRQLLAKEIQRLRGGNPYTVSEEAMNWPIPETASRLSTWHCLGGDRPVLETATERSICLERNTVVRRLLHHL